MRTLSCLLVLLLPAAAGAQTDVECPCFSQEQLEIFSSAAVCGDTADASADAEQASILEDFGCSPCCEAFPLAYSGLVETADSRSYQCLYRDACIADPPPPVTISGEQHAVCRGLIVQRCGELNLR